MRTNDVQDELAEGFEPTALPPVSPDGGLELPPMREAPRHPPRLCEQGPCSHYHVFKIQLDAQKPMATRGADGQIEMPDAPDHAETHHYCYPAVGIESKLGSLPVIQCNRWAPMSLMELKHIEQRHESWHESAAGQKYLAELAAYRQEQDRIAAAGELAAVEAADDLANMPAGQCELRFEVRDAEGVHPVGDGRGGGFAFNWDETLGHVRRYVCADAFMTDDELARFSIHRVQPRANGPWISEALDPALTISQVGLSSGDLVMFDLQPPKETP